MEKTRRNPQRASSLNTVETIFEATARILQAQGRAALNTNRIAREAGVSVGSLYAYFPNKEAILVAMARRELVLLSDSVMAAIARDDPETPALRRAIRALIAGYTARDQARRLVMESLIAAGHGMVIHEAAGAVAAFLAAGEYGLLPRAASAVDLFVLTRAVDSVVRLATYEDTGFLHAAIFEDSLVRLVEGYFRAP